MQITPYLGFDGQCREAFEFYREVLGGEGLDMMTYGDSPIRDQMPADSHERIMHARLVVDGVQLMGADGPPISGPRTPTISVALNLDEASEAERVFAAFSEGGRITMPMEKTFWAERFGMCVDRFGTPWIINGNLAEEHR